MAELQIYLHGGGNRALALGAWVMSRENKAHPTNEGSDLKTGTFGYQLRTGSSMVCCIVVDPIDRCTIMVNMHFSAVNRS